MKNNNNNNDTELNVPAFFWLGEEADLESLTEEQFKEKYKENQDHNQAMKEVGIDANTD